VDAIEKKLQEQEEDANDSHPNVNLVSLPLPELSVYGTSPTPFFSGFCH